MMLSRILLQGALLSTTVCSPGYAEDVYYIPASTQKICQLTGEVDFGHSPPITTGNKTETRAKLRGTDLGISFRGPFESLFFFFGDTAATTDVVRAEGADSVAYATTSDDPEDCMQLTFMLAPDGGYKQPVLLDHPPRSGSIQLGNWEVPTGGFFWDGKAYVTFQVEGRGEGENYRPTRSTMASNARIIYEDLTFTSLYDFDPDKFMNISSALVDDTWTSAAAPNKVLYFGTGLYRRADNVYLARGDLADLDTGKRMYFSGIDAVGNPIWDSEPKSAQGVFSSPNAKCMGELSVTWNPYLGKWLMLYSCGSPRGINFRVADKPWGPWSETAVLFEPRADGGYCQFMYDLYPCPPGSPNPLDGWSHASANKSTIGGEYGAYVIEAFTKGSTESRTTTIYFTMSTWNPYQVVLMRSTLVAK